MMIKFSSWQQAKHEQQKNKIKNKSAAAANPSVSRREMFTWFLFFFSFYTMCREWLILPSSLHIMWSPGTVDHIEKDDEGIRMKETPPIIGDTDKTKQLRMHSRLLRNNKIKCSKGETSDFCDMVGDIRVHPDAATAYYVIPPNTDVIRIAGDNNSSTTPTSSSSWTIKPYARNGDKLAMASVTEWSVEMVSSSANDHHHRSLNCSQVHDSPGIVFSLGGYSGNHYHGFADVLIPLFVTARPFDRHVELVIVDSQPWMVNKVKTIMQALSRYDLVDIDKAKQEGKTHCFSKLIIGLKGRGKKELGIDPLETKYTMKDFRQFLRSAYSLNKTTTTKLQSHRNKKRSLSSIPRLLIISRRSSRTFTNVNEIARMAAKLGYDVTVVEPDMAMPRSAEIVNSCDVVMGVHGAGLANMVFLPDNAIVVQVIPLALDWSARAYYEEPTKDMDLRYLQYKIKNEESSLIGPYPPDDVVFTNPWSFKWEEFKSIYLQNQNVTINLRRFRPTLLKALELLHN